MSNLSSSLLDKYPGTILEHGWSRAVLEAQIETSLHERQGKAITNFDRALPAPMSELAQQLLKDPYNFDFLTLHDEAVEGDILVASLARNGTNNDLSTR